MNALAREFSLIEHYFRPLAGTGALALTDDAALFHPPPGLDLVLSADAMVAGVHFPPDEAPDLVARKLLRVNLSDLAAKGAKPLGYLLTIAAPAATPDFWFEAFTTGLANDQRAFGLALLGGDMTATSGPFSLSLTILGTVPPGQAVLRRGAEAGHGVFVSGTIGDAALGLDVLEGRLADASGFLIERYRLPTPRLGLPLPDFAAAAMDISDGLVQDLGHLCRLGGVAAEIDATLVPLSEAARAAGPAFFSRCLTGGDDYELLLAVSPHSEDRLTAARFAVPLTRIGRFVPGSPEVRVLGPQGKPMQFPRLGWSHF